MATNTIINNSLPQPQTQPQVIINNSQPQPQPQPPTQLAVHSNQWSTGIFGCFDDLDVCCFAYWCFPCFACKTASEFGECSCLPLVDILCDLGQLVGVPVGVPPVSMSMRVAVRSRYGIQGDIASDCVYATVFNTCSWCQVAREIKRRTPRLTVISAQPPVFMGPQQYVMPTQPAVVTAQPVISPAPRMTFSARIM